MLKIFKATAFIVFELLRDNQHRDVGVKLSTHIHTHTHTHTHILGLTCVILACGVWTQLMFIFSSFEKYIFFYCDTFLKQSFYGHGLQIEKRSFE